MTSRLTTKRQLVSLIVAAVTGLCADYCLAGVVCGANSGNTKRICVEWGKQTDPVQNVDFSVDYTCQGCSDAPAVELSTGDTAWVAYSEVISTGAVANIGALTTTDADNYGVKIAKGSGAGAANAGSMVLTPNGSAYYSSLLDGSAISGDLTGALALQKSSGGTGGVASFTIGGDVLADITIPKLSYLYVGGNVGSNVTIQIEDAVPTAASVLFGGYAVSPTFSGTLSFPNGLVGMDKQVAFFATLTETGAIDFHGAELGCQLNLYGGASTGSVLSAGTLTGSVRLGEDGHDFFGTTLFESMFGQIELEVANLEGSINVFGDWGGRLQMFGDVTERAVISVGGNLTPTGAISVYGYGDLGDLDGVVDVVGSASGSITAWRNIRGPITIAKNFDGEILANQLGVHGGAITGDVTIDGQFDGNICGDNLSAAGPLPSNISIGCGLGPPATVCGQPPVCPAANIVTAVPPSGTRDARQPYPQGPTGTEVFLNQRQGIGSPNPDASEEDRIKLTLNASGLRTISHNCWSLCETGKEPVDTGTPELSPNKISCIKESVVAGNQYQIILERPVSAKNWTTIRYTGGTQKISYASLPADVSADGYAGPSDILNLIDCINGQPQWCPFGHPYGTDIDHSGLTAPADILDEIDLLNGAGNFIVWNGKTLPENTCAGRAMLAESLPGPLSAEEENQQFADWFVNYIATGDPKDEEGEKLFQMIVESLTQWCVDHFTVDEKKALADRLSDPTLAFASEPGRLEAATVVAALGS
ncbi:MAG: hypothetical protein Q7R41_02285 [Phycisphaerales bacterium]|nr:hypothetical protein [Phycisphaerales bacterium]